MPLSLKTFAHRLNREKVVPMIATSVFFRIASNSQVTRPAIKSRLFNPGPNRIIDFGGVEKFAHSLVMLSR